MLTSLLEWSKRMGYRIGNCMRKEERVIVRERPLFFLLLYPVLLLCWLDQQRTEKQVIVYHSPTAAVPT